MGSFGAANASSGSSSLSASPTAATGAGDLLVAVIRTRNITTLAPVSTVADSATNSWTRATSKSQGSGDEEIWYAASAHSLTTAQSVTVTVGGSAAASTAIAFTVLDVSGAAASSPLDVVATNAASSGQTASTGTTATTTQGSEIAISDIAWNTASITVSGQTAGYTQLPTQTSKVTSSATGEQGAWQLLSTTGAQSYSATLSASAAWTGAIATFKTGTAPVPTITSFNPTSGPVGTPVTITGTGFTGASAVKFFNGVSAAFSVTDDSHISTSVPATAATGAITVTAPGGTVTSTATFTVTTSPTPTITGFSPTSGPVGTPVTITGTGFTGATAVKFFNGVSATFTVTDDAHISTSVPSGAATGAITVTAPGGAVTSTSNFTVTTSPTPTITGFSPTSGPVGTPVTITGTGFTGASAVKFFNGVSATFTVTDDSHISTSVPTGAATGVIKVTAPGGTATSSTSFTVTSASHPPHIMLIVDENKYYQKPKPGWQAQDGYIFNNTHAPYLNQLIGQYASATNWYSLAHPSFKNYQALISGATIGSIPRTDPTLIDQLAGAGIPWTAYMEGLNFPGAPSSCDSNATHQEVYDNVNPYQYEWDHNPYWYFSGSTSTSECNNVVPYPGSTNLLSTLNGPNPPDFVQISPNGCDDGHGPEPSGQACQYSETESADLWFQGATNLEGVTPTYGCPSYCLNLPAILSSSWYQSGGIIIITWDEAPLSDTSGGGLPNTAGGQVATIVISSTSHGAFTSAGNDYGILRAIEEKYGLPLLANAANSANGDLSGAFGSASPGSISGNVRDSSTTNPISGASISCTGTPTCTATTTDTSGNYTLANLAAGTYQVTVSATGYATQTLPVTVTSGSTATQNFSMTPASGSISGTVTDSSTHAAISGASVSCTGTPICTATTTASNGTYALSNLATGTYSVQVTASGYATGSASVPVTSGANSPQDFALTPNPGSITGTVTDSVTHSPISGANVTCSVSPSCTGTTTAVDGTYTLSGLVEGTYQVTAAATNYQSSTISVIVGPGGTPTQNFALTPNTGTINGTVSDSISHNPILGASVSCTGPPSCTPTTTDSGGTYLLNNLTEGSYQVMVSMSGYASQTIGVVVGPGGTPTQNFALVAGTTSLSVVQSFGAANSGSTGGTTLAATTATQTGNGDLLVLTIKTRSTATVAVTGIADNASPANTWKKATGVGSGQADEEVWYVPGARSITSVTVTVSGAASMAMTVADISGASATSPLDQFATSSGNSATPSTGTTPATTQTTEIVIGDIGWNNSATLGAVAFTPQTTITLLPSQSSSVTSLKTSEEMAWQVVAAVHTQSLSGTLSGAFAWTGAIATFH
jgi:Carboxypeptidase regulatory-like domain/IPT/TIG domain